MNRWAIAGCVALGCAGMVTAGLVEAQARERAPARQSRYTKDLVVTLVTPTNNQEVLQDLSDPGLNGKITVRFSSPPRKRDIIDNQNPFNRLTTKVEFFDSTFSRLPGEPRVRKNVFTFDPFDVNQPVLPNGQYTLNLKRNLRNGRGRLLNSGVADFTTTFSVGTDNYQPVLRRISPIHRQNNIGLQQPIVCTFNEPIDLASLISTITVQDSTTNPPTPILGAGGGTGVSLARNGFDVVFTPSPCFGYPPKTTISFIMQGLDNPDDGSDPTTAPITDVFGNGFARDNGLQWTLNQATGLYESPNGTYDEKKGIGLFRMDFETKGVKPAPQATSPASPQFTATPFANPCGPVVWFPPSCYATGSALHYTSANGLGQISFLGIVNRFNQGITDLSLMQVVPNTPVRMGRPGGMVVDPRWDPATFHTFMYMVDQRTKTVAVVDSRNFKILGRFAGFVSPRDVTVSTNFGRNTTTLWVSDFASNQVVGVDLQSITVTFGGQPGAPSPCDAINDNSQQDRRFFVEVGQGPTGISADSFLNARVMVCNTMGNSISIVSVGRAEKVNDYEVGSTPVDCDWTMIGLGAIPLGMVANQGGLNDPDGSISVYIENFPTGFSGTRTGIENTFTDKVKNPSSVYGQQQWINGFGNAIPGQEFFIPNTGSNTVVEYGVTVTGGFGTSVNAAPIYTYDIGLNPTSASYDPFYPALFIFASAAGNGAVGAAEPRRATPATLNRAPGIQRIFTAYHH